MKVLGVKIKSASSQQEREILGGLTVSTKAALSPGSDRSGHHHKEVVDDDSVVKLALEDGIEIYTSAKVFYRELIPREQSRGQSKDEFILPEKLVYPVDGDRGLIELAIKAVSFLDIKGKAVDIAGGFAAKALATKIEDQIIGQGGLYSIADIQELEEKGKNSAQSHRSVATEEEYHPVARKDIPVDQPVLIFIHGTASTTAGSFSGLWTEGRTDWEELKSKFGKHIYGFEHRTLSVSPLRNALDLINSLPENASVHLVSHSRGGIVGELLCRGVIDSGEDPFTKEDFAYFEEKGNRYLKEIIDAIQGAKEDYGQHRKDLKELASTLAKKKVKIEQFVRVACPARGTTLASGKLDFYLSTLLNLAKIIPGLAGNVVFGILESLTLVVAKERTDPAALPGLEAQMPGSPLISMLNDETRTSKAPLVVVAGDIEPQSVWRKVALLLVDRFYETDHDLVVNTPSMDGGAPREKSIPIMEDRGADVNHFTYFSRKKSRQGIVAALIEDQDLPSGFQVRTQKPVYIPRSVAPEDHGPETPRIIVLPGIAGSHLQENADRIWIDPRDLAWGGLERLKMGSAEPISQDGVVGVYYHNLVEHLSDSYAVTTMAYDWRQSVLESAKDLAAEIERQLKNSSGPVHIIAHSMGGLLVRALIADLPEVWNRFQQRRGSKVLMLGTPNSGSFSILRLLTGQDNLIKSLALLDFKNDRWDLIKILREFPGILELLPNTEDQKYFRPEIWKELTKAVNPRGTQSVPKSFKDALDGALRTCNQLNKVKLDAEYVFYIAGHASQTPVGMEIDGQEITFTATSHGDGRVPWEDGIPKGIKCWYVDTEHGNLANYAPAFEAFSDILDSGETLKLKTTPPISRNAAKESEMRDDHLDLRPTRSELSAHALGVRPWAPVSQARKLPQVNVSVSHCDLCFSKDPVMVGHYQSDALVHAEAYMNDRLNGRLSECYDLGIYPGPLGTNEIILRDENSSNFPGAVIVGLGVVGELTTGTLCETLTRAFLRVAITSNSFEKSLRPISISTLLIGTGDGGVSLENSIAATLKAVTQANERILKTDPESEHLIGSLQFIELYHDLAETAQKILSNPDLDTSLKRNFLIEKELGGGSGGRKRTSFYDNNAWWDRLRIKSEKGNLSFLALTQRAGVPLVTRSEEKLAVQPFLAEVTSNTDANPNVGKVLFELLLPYEFKQHSRNSRDLVLVLDRESAQYPWEVLEFGGDQTNESLALRAGLIRQLSTGARARNLCLNGKALIIGDPDYEGSKVFAQLPGAQEEAILVDSKLRERFDCIGPVIGGKSSKILTHIIAEEYQILHLAAHGVFEYLPKISEDSAATTGTRATSSSCSCEKENPKPKTGVVIGPNQILTSEMIEDLSSTPEFVFLNCCHLGKIADSPSMNTPLQEPHRLAANIATQFIQKGVRAVIAAGWAVSDAAAQTFANTFYKCMLSGQSFGESVLSARKITHDLHPTKNTWAAYQCYGDPSYRFSGGNAKPTKRPSEWHFASLEEAQTEIDNLSESLKTANALEARAIRKSLDNISSSIPENWRSKGILQAALGRCWGELLEFKKAIEAYEKAIHAADGKATFACIEQLANLEARYAAEKGKEAEKLKEADNKIELGQVFRMMSSLISSSRARIASLCEISGKTSERKSIQGSTEKRVAQIYTQLGRNDEKVIGPLNEMKVFYGDAFEMVKSTNSNYVYPLLQYLTASWLLTRFFGGESDDRFALRYDLLSGVDPDLLGGTDPFWINIIRCDISFFSALVNGSLESELDKLVREYLRVKSTASTPREFGSVCEQFEFLYDLLKGKEDGGLADLILELKTKLENS